MEWTTERRYRLYQDWTQEEIQNIKENMAQQQVINICDKKCEYCCKDKGTVDKLIDLDTRSICKDSGYRLQQI